jgi:hypothetical protein
MKIYKDDKNLIISIPLKQASTNPYSEEQVELDNIIGVIAGNEYGFCNLNDMSYKGKEPQIGSWWVKFDEILDNALGDRETKTLWFTKLCHKLGIDFYVYPVCSKCGEVIYGCFTIGKNGKDLCFDCDKEK